MVKTRMDAALRRSAFVTAFCSAGDGFCQPVAAARLAGFRGPDKTVQNRASELMSDPDVMREIQSRFAQAAVESIASAEECMTVLSAHLRGTMADFLRVNKEDGTFEIDAMKAEAAEKLGLIRKCRLKKHKGTDPFGNEFTETECTVELYDAQAAAQTLLRALGCMGKGKPLYGSKTDANSLHEKRRRVAQLYMEMGTPRDEWLPSVRHWYEKNVKPVEATTR